MGWATSRMGGATSFPYPALPSRFKSLLNANGEEFVLCQMRANETYSEAKCQFSVRNRDILINVCKSPHKWWSTLKSVVFGLSTSLPLLVGEGGGLVCESVGKADLLSDRFDGKSRESVDLPFTCHPSLRLTSFAFRSSEVRRLVLDLDLIGALTHWVCFLFFLRELMFWPLVLV